MEAAISVEKYFFFIWYCSTAIQLLLKKNLCISRYVVVMTIRKCQFLEKLRWGSDENFFEGKRDAMESSSHFVCSSLCEFIIPPCSYRKLEIIFYMALWTALRIQNLISSRKMYLYTTSPIIKLNCKQSTITEFRHSFHLCSIWMLSSVFSHDVVEHINEFSTCHHAL